jgi:hypothetical protein
MLTVIEGGAEFGVIETETLADLVESVTEVAVMTTVSAVVTEGAV